MKHIVIGTLFALIVLLLGGCKSIVESNPAIFGNYVGKPVTGRQATYAHAAIIAQNTGDMSQLRTVWQRQNQQRQCASQVGGRHVLRLWIGNGGNPNSLLEDFTDTWEEFT